MGVLTDEQQMLKDMAAEWARDRVPVSAYRSLFESPQQTGSDPALYAEMASMGWAGIVVPEAYGGSDFGYLSLGIVLEELGRTLVASPLLSSALASATALRIAGSDAQRAQWLPGIADGSVIGTLAIDEGGRHSPVETGLKAIRQTPDRWQLSGAKRPVQDGMAADIAIVAARTSGAPGDSNGLSLFIVETGMDGLTRKPLDQIDARHPALFEFDNAVLSDDAALGEIDQGGPLLEILLDHARAGLASELLGSATQAFETTLVYLKTRVQFGQLIGSFQALQHRASAMFGELMLTRSAVEAALAAIDNDDPETPKLVSVAKALAGDTALHIANEMVQMHGGIGMTHEHDAGLYMRRIRVADQCYGNAAFHRERWGSLNGF